jgi:hypothetical protein
MRNTPDPYGAERGEMSSDDFGIDADRAERMLNGEPVGPDGLVRLLAALRPEAYRAETPVAGEERALATFRLGYRPEPVRHRRPAWARLVTVKLVVIALGVLAGGVAVAAGVGVLPDPFRPGAASRGPTTVTPPDGSSTTAGSPSPSASATASASARPDVPGLCRAFLSEGDLGKATHNPRFADLVQLAGGPENVHSYCTAVLASPDPGNGHGHQPSGHPTHTPQPHPTGKPTSPGPRS